MTRPISDRIAAQAVELLASGLGLRTVARQLGVPRTTLRETVARHVGSPAAWSLRRRPPTGNPMGRPLGYREAWTYTLPEEPGTSLRAAGFEDMGLTAGGEHDRPSRRRKPAVRPEPKRRWMRSLRPR